MPPVIGQLLAVTLAAQLGTLPISIFHFHQLSIISPITNLLIIPSLGILLITSIGGICLPFDTLYWEIFVFFSRFYFSMGFKDSRVFFLSFLLHLIFTTIHYNRINNIYICFIYYSQLHTYWYKKGKKDIFYCIKYFSNNTFYNIINS